ncbi:MAG: type II toxin-antitoxin system death-on-curing family toxin [Deltaproteobacteria bacterium]|nr:type II toxin-antitoxin system death-on-curing family toxin [Deltaproteobacteria bacterium]
MRYLSLLEVLELHEMIISFSGGSYGIRDIKTLKSAINQPRITFDQIDLYPDIISKASALCFSLVMNHPFTDGNKRVGHAAMEIFQILNGYEIEAPVDEQVQIFFDLARGNLTREAFTNCLKGHVIHKA